MSLRRFIPFSSATSIKTNRDSVRRTPAPTYISNATDAPTYLPNESRTTSGHNRYESAGSWSAISPRALSIVSPETDTAFNLAELSPTDTVNVGETSVEIKKPAGPRYIYYRVYADDGDVPSANPVYTDDPSLGRIEVKLVTPPHTVLNLKRCLSRIENIDVNIQTSLFVSPSSQAPMDDTGRVSILAYPGPGCTPNEPMALVAMCSNSDRGLSDVKRPETVLLPPQEGPTPFEAQYLYYRTYKKDGAILSKQPADPNNPDVGRIRVDSVPPPHTAASIMRCISKIEELDNSKQSLLFVNISSESPIDEGHVSILTSSRPGSTLDDPMAFVESPDPVAAPTQASRKPVPVAKSSRTSVAEPIPSAPVSTKLLRVIAESSHSQQNPGWLKVTKGEILRATQDLPHCQRYNWFDGTHQSSAYQAINNAGQTGFVSAACVQELVMDSQS